MQAKGLFDILEEYFGTQVNTTKEGINGEIEKYEACYGLLHSLIADLYEMSEQVGSDIKESVKWEDKFDTYFDECMTEYIMYSGNVSDVSDDKAEQYIPYEFATCSKCGIRCFYNAYPEAIETEAGKIVCEHCIDI